MNTNGPIASTTITETASVTAAGFDHAKFKANQKQSWSEAAEGWTEGVGRAMMLLSDPLVQFGGVQPGERVLDLATGGGSAAFAAARAGAREVIASDLASGFRHVVESKAAAQGLEGIVRFAEADMEALPFADNEFDRAVCQLGIMFPPDRSKALREILRVVKPGGVFAAATLACAEENKEFAPVIEYPRMLAGAHPNSPHPLICGDREGVMQEFRAAGFVDVAEQDFDFHFRHSSIEQAEIDWKNTAPLKLAFEKLDEEKRQQLQTFLIDWLGSHQRPDGSIELANRVLLFRGRKPI
jgi:SAM-dependent methyltransferase